MDLSSYAPQLTALLPSFKQSCQWWLTHHPSHPFLKDTAQKNWLNFCALIQDSHTTDAFIHTIDTYLVPIKGIPPFFKTTHQNNDVFATGYYEPSLKGSRTASTQYTTPLYTLPLMEDKKIPRHLIENGALKGKNLELVFVDDPIKAFFLEIQGSGRIYLDDGTIMRVGYAGQNGYPYTPIGKPMFEKGLLTQEDLTLRGIQSYLYKHPEQIQPLLNQNESYVFFKEILKDSPHTFGPLGTQGLPLVPRHSVAVDHDFWPFGMLMMLNLDHPDLPHQFVMSQDTGGAIKGPLRFDLFWGWDESAEEKAGNMKHKGSLVSFWPKGTY